MDKALITSRSLTDVETIDNVCDICGDEGDKKKCENTDIVKPPNNGHFETTEFVV